MTRRFWIAAWFIVMVALSSVGFFVGESLFLATLVSAPFAVGSFVACWRLDRDRQLGLVDCFALALALRWIAATVIHYAVYPTYPLLFALDEGGYDVLGQEFADYLAGRIGDPTGGTSPSGIVWLVALCYYAVDHIALLPKLLNGIVGAWTAVLTALLAAHLTSPAVGRRAGVLAAVFPSLVLWASIIVKDTLTLLGVLMALYAAARMVNRVQTRHLPTFVAGIALVLTNRPYEIVFVIAGIVGSLAFGPKKRLLKTWGVVAVLGVLLALMVSRSFSDLIPFATSDETLTDRVTLIRSGYLTDAGSALDISGYETNTLLGLLMWLPIGLLAFYLAPIPFTGTSIISFATSPEMILWYALIPSMLRGWRAAYRSGLLRGMAPAALYVLASSIGWASVVTNVGTLYRYRAQTLFVPLILIALDQVSRRAARARVQQRSFVPSVQTEGSLAR